MMLWPTNYTMQLCGPDYATLRFGTPELAAAAIAVIRAHKRLAQKVTFSLPFGRGVCARQLRFGTGDQAFQVYEFLERFKF